MMWPNSLLNLISQSQNASSQNRLLGHELTHVVQQGSAMIPPNPGWADVTVRGWDPISKRPILGRPLVENNPSTGWQNALSLNQSLQSEVEQILPIFANDPVRGIELLTALQKSKHDAAMAAIQNTR
jgi:hypothetical protein